MFKKLVEYKYFPFVLIIFVTLLYLIPLMKPGFFVTHDGEDHMVRIGATYKAITDGHIPPKWVGDLNYEYGVPLFIFNYPLPAYIGTLIYSLGLNITDSYKLLLGLSFLLAPITFYLWIRTLVNKETAIIASFFYGFAPYHFLNLYVRADIGELFAFVFIPLVFLAIQKIQESKRHYFFLGIISYALLILSHNIVSLIFSPIIAIYILLTTRKIKQIIMNANILFFGLCLSSYFWIPALFERKFVNHELFEGFFAQHFISPLHLLYSAWGFGADIHKAGGLSPQLGIVTTLIVIAGLFKFKKIKNKIYLFFLFVFIFFVFMTTSYSTILWNTIPLLPQFEFPWRLLAISSFALAVIGAFTLEKFSKKFGIFITILFLLCNILFLKTNSPLQKNDSYYFSFPGTTFYHNEATTIWTEGNAYKIPDNPIEIIGGDGQITNVTRKTQIHTFNVNAKTDMQIMDNTQYFPGWTVFADGKKIPIEFQDINHRGIITFKLPKGSYTVAVKFLETKDRIVGNILSVGTIVLLLVIYFAKIDVYIKKRYA